MLCVNNIPRVINTSFDWNQYNDLRLFFMFSEIEKKLKSIDRHKNVLLCFYERYFRSYIINIKQKN